MSSEKGQGDTCAPEEEEEVKKVVCKRNRQSSNCMEDGEEPVWAEKSVVKKPREDDEEAPTGNQDGDDDDDDDDDYDDLEDDEPGMDDFLDEDEDDVMMEDDRQSTSSSTSTTFSTGSSVGSNTPSLIGENLESFCLSGNEGGAADKESKSQFRTISTSLVRSSIRPLKRSLFSHVPPAINFVHHNEVSETPLPAEVRKHLRWKLSNITPAVVKRIVTNSGFRLMRKTCSEWGGSWGKHMKSPMFKDLQESQKLNHLPGTFNIGRKDRLWKNYHRLRLKFGRDEFSFLPRTFLLPSEARLLRKVWERKGCRAKWIVKPPALARGAGIKVVNKWSQIPKSRPLVVQKYIARPHLINGTKYDLRIYVLLTSLCPLRVFLYNEGLVRFASNAYSSDSESLSDVFRHLTNYSINKNSGSYVANEDSECRQGHKWTLASLWAYYAENGIDSKPVIDAIKDLIIKTIISAEHNMFNAYRPNLPSHYCGYELFGFDVLLDHKLKPWLIEVNISPSLHSSSTLDLDVKSPLATEVFNLARYHIPPAKLSSKTQKEILSQLNMTSSSQLCMDRKLYARELSKSERAKHDRFVAPARSGDRSNYLESILETLTPDDVRFLVRSEDELSQATHFARIFPTQDTHKYFKYFETQRYHNLLFDAWETKYGDDHLRAAAIDRLERLCVNKFHLKVPTISAKAAAEMTSLNKTTGKKLKQVPDVSMLKAPTPAAVTRQDTGEGDAKPAGENVAPAAAKSSSSVVSVTAKHHSLCKSSMIAAGRIRPLPNAQRVAAALSSSSPAESMSVSGDPSASSSEKSRSPSPPVPDRQTGTKPSVLDNREFLQNAKGLNGNAEVSVQTGKLDNDVFRTVRREIDH